MSAYLVKPKGDPTFLERLDANLRSSPGVQSAALAYPAPFDKGGLTSSFTIRGREPAPGEPEWHGEAFMVSSGFFATLHIPLLRGRNLDDSDAAGKQEVCVIDTHMVERFFPNQDPIGREIAMYGGWARIVGVVAAIRDTSLETNARPTVYYSFPQVPFFSQFAVLVRSAQAGAPIIRAAVRQTNRSVPIFDVMSLNDRVAASLGLRRVMAILVTVFGAICLLLATVGLHGVAAQLVAERTPEIGVRMALGARPGQILSRFFRQGLLAGGVGLIVGLALSVFAQKWLGSLLYGVRPFDVATFSGACLVLLLILSAAVYWPARRAAGIDPQRALRHE
jgi:predicted permease